ncbi:amidohydrolase family protein [Flagellimonas hymeniacidonis]|uniref:Amidohydrolase family protein n=1 Tax=Flagellimonas hymeniacidonis TaxID=2603628 RepID=A0A5C8V3U5_9FLAO|nr:amidohydrolase family protein [Flagellimonas hymeniacidonis]TXN35702.1 amidohydrolase family protein [Flagellimonas hymeniacidonis]
MRTITILTFFIIAIGVNAQNIYLKNVNIFDGNSNTISSTSAVKIKGKTIEWIGNQLSQDPDGYQVIDGLGYYLMPGMIDAHTHISDFKAAERALNSGVTTVRSASTKFYQDVTLGNLAKKGVIPGPDFVSAGVYVTPNLGETILADTRLSNLSEGVYSEEALRQLVRINAARGVDVIKTRGTERAGLPETDPRQQTYTKEQLRIVVDEAAKHNLKVMVHAHGDEGGRAAVEAGVVSIEHGTFLSRATLGLMKTKGTFLVPTFITIEDLKVPGGEYSNPTLELRGKFMMVEAERTIKEALALGVKMATGADNDYSAESTTRVSLEAEHFVRLGMTNFQALQAATKNGAELLGLSNQIGTLESGKEADMILLPNNPLEDIVALQDVLLVISNGQIALKRIPFTLNE